MIRPQIIKLKFVPDGTYAKARILTLTPRKIDHMLMQWWSHDSLLPNFTPEPIDRRWRWDEHRIERRGIVLDAERIGIVTGDGSIQGAMQISTRAHPSGLVEGAATLFIELLFTAPWNRPQLRRDRAEFYKGVGLSLLIWAGRKSRELGFDGRLRLDGSPDYVDWYERRGFVKLDEEPVVWENIEYTPMELPLRAAKELLNPPIDG